VETQAISAPSLVRMSDNVEAKTKNKMHGACELRSRQLRIVYVAAEQGNTGIDRFGHFADKPAANVTQCLQND
jgi:hypothetical protein